MGNRPAISLRLAVLTRKQRLAACTAFALAALAALPLFKSDKAHAAAEQPDAPGPAMIRKDGKIVVPSNSPLRSRVMVAPVSNLAAPHTVSLPGVVEADPARTVNILPPLSGRLIELKVRLGDAVKQGQLLAVISAPDLDQAWSDVEKARDAEDLAKKALERARNVHDAGANALKDFEQANSNYIQAASETKRAQARLATLGMGSKSRTLSLAAPVSGTVTALNNGQGSYLNDTTATLMTISNLDSVWITASVPEDLAGAITRGQAVEVELPAFPGKRWKGSVSFVSAVLEPDTHRNKTRIAFANADGKLKPNMYATVDIAVPQASGIAVPTSALLMNNDSVTVLVETAPWTFERRAVELGREDNEIVRIVSGLTGSEHVVVKGGVLLND
jgi:cobalt-zinc-cadmium efflux system membrane fusion protein